MDFKCKECGGTRLTETMKDVVVHSECYFTAEGDFVYDDQSNEDGEVVGFQCDKGHWVVDDSGERVTDSDELYRFLNRNEILDVDEVIAKISLHLKNSGGPLVADIHNQLSEHDLYADGCNFKWK